MATRQPSTFVSMADSLAAQHRPILRFDDVEKWRPLNVDSFLSERLPTGEPYHRSAINLDVGHSTASTVSGHGMRAPIPTVRKRGFT